MGEGEGEVEEEGEGEGERERESESESEREREREREHSGLARYPTAQCPTQTTITGLYWLLFSPGRISAVRHCCYVNFGQAVNRFDQAVSYSIPGA